MQASRVAVFVLAVLLLVVPSPIPGQEKKPADPPVPTIEELVSDLGHPAYSAREKAQRELWKRGDIAIPALERVLNDENPEVVRRARELLDKFSWGVRPDTPAEVLKLLRQFQVGDQNPQKSAEVRKSAIIELLKHGTAGILVAKALLRKPFADDVRAQVIEQVTTLLRREVPLLLFAGKTDEAAELIALHTVGTGPQGASDYAVFQVLRGNLPAAITTCEAGVKAENQTANQKLILAHLYRASGDWAKARATAADIPQPQGAPRMVDLLREEEGDWDKLAETGYGGELNHPDAVRLSLLRLAGKQKQFDQEAKDLAKAANELASAEEVFETVVALFCNNRADEATKILLERKQNLGLLGEVLIQRLQYKEALDLAGGKERSAKEKLEFNLRRARILMHIGRRSDAIQLFGSVFEGLRKPPAEDDEDSGTSIMSVRSLLRTEMRVGLKDLAAEHAALFLTQGIFRRHQHAATGESAFELLFNQDATSGEALFEALRQKKIPGNEPGPTMVRVRELLVGKANKTAVDEALKALRGMKEEEIFSTEGRPAIGRPVSAVVSSKQFQSRQQLAIAAVCRAANRDADAEAAYKAATELATESADLGGARSWVYGTSDAYVPFVEWGDFLFDRGRYHEASERYLAGWKKFPEQPLLMFLSGKALVKAGNIKEGERRIELSHWVSLGQERIRGRFLDELVRRGEGKTAKRETDLVLRACWCRDHYFGNVMNQAAHATSLVKDFATAAHCSQRSLLVLMKTPGMYYVETSAYMIVPHDVLIYRTRAALAAGKLDEAMASARAALAVTPGHLVLVSGMVPALEKLGKKADADELFGIAWRAYEKVLADFPDSPSARNGLATLSANCRRDLDKGLKYAREAVKADPGSVTYRESLAEVLFRSGDRDKAVEVLTTLTAEDPRNPLYRRQLVRYRTGAVDSPKPETED
ncbi:MAG: tetratricopeptide repeat protein [Planctomycetes bacterium]|nr:tetratricopeptide repeat protein [Planctomycetota bacterium]